MRPAEALDDVNVCDVVSGAREFRLALDDWAKSYSSMRRRAPSPANDTADAARADLRSWSTRYFTPVAAAE